MYTQMLVLTVVNPIFTVESLQSLSSWAKFTLMIVLLPMESRRLDLQVRRVGKYVQVLG